MTNEDSAPLEKFEKFVSEILTVTKDEIKNLEDEERRLKAALTEQDEPDAEPC